LTDSRRIGVPAVGVDTDGKMNKLIPPFAKAGVKNIWPFEVQTGMDVREVRTPWPRQ